jgi:hypothetical protein
MRLIYRPCLRLACSSVRPLARRNIYCFHSALVSRGIMTSSEPHEAQDVPKEVSEAQEAEGWKTQLPYKIHEKQSFNALYDASCHCGRVTYQLSREKPLDAKFCHCKTCQRLHGKLRSLDSMTPSLLESALILLPGAPFQWAAIFHKQDINFINGYSNLVWYESSEKVVEHRLPCKITCSYCRTPIMDEGRNMILLFPTLINFKSQEDRKKFDPTSAPTITLPCMAAANHNSTVVISFTAVVW